MCGIAGQLQFARDIPADPAAVARMANAMRHRGPDDSGVESLGPLALGFRRLSILDLSPAGHQPMKDPTGSAWIVFNGEIYNFRELRAELETRGHTFRSTGDTEVLLAGYNEWGDGVLNRLNGMFALAIWDVAKRRLLLARDAMGIKPLYYAENNGTLTFGSEIRAVLVGLGNVPEVDHTAAALFLQHRFTPAPRTLHAGIAKLAPGECLIVERGVVRRILWHDFAPTPFDPAPPFREAVDALHELYRAAMRRHLISDVPAGLLLSGGIDSGLLLSLMMDHGSSWPTYTVGYGESFADDELSDAAETARLLGAENHAVRIDRAAFENALPEIVAALEEPVASSSIVPMDFVCARARQDVTVALVGQGPDELFGGYTRHFGVRYGRFWRALPAAVRGVAGDGLLRLRRSEALRRGIDSLGEPDRARRFRDILSIIPGAEIAALFQPGALPLDASEETPHSWEHLTGDNAGCLDELSAFNHVELHSTLPDELLVYADKISMRHSLEVRVPYLDREIVRYVQRLPARYKVHLGQRKRIHRAVCGSRLPARLLARKKRGFAVNVVDDWFKGAFTGRFEAVFHDRKSRIYEFLQFDPVRDLAQSHASGCADRHKILFSLVMLEEWLQNCRSMPLSDPSFSDADRHAPST